MIGRSELRIACTAGPADVRKMRHALDAFLAVFPIDRTTAADIQLAVGEALANAVEHAASGAPSPIELIARAGAADMLAVDVCDRGRFVERERLPDRGFGLNIVRAIARSVEIRTDDGTHVHMIFGPLAGA